jgi:DNA-binding beta-propeller fold protein YncE
VKQLIICAHIITLILLLMADSTLGNQLYWANEQGFAIYRSNLNGSSASPLLPFLNAPWDVVVDEATAKIYWTESIGDRIASANIDGTGAAPIITIDSPASLAADFINGKLYWSGGVGVRRANLDGSNVELIGAEGVDVTGVAVDAFNQFVYYADHFANRIVRQPLGGGQPQFFLSGLADSPLAIAINVQSNLIYWTDSNNLWKANLLDGSNRTILYPNSKYSRDIFLDHSRGLIWWTWEQGGVGGSTGGISSAPISGGGPVGTFGVPFRPVGLWVTNNLVPQGDYDRNGIVNAADYVLWRDKLGHIVPACSGADANCDAFIEPTEYQPFRRNFGQTAGGNVDGTAVPERTSLIMLFIGAVIYLVWCRRPS